MRRTYISPEFNYNKVYGTYNMVEQSSFFGSKMMDIEDKIIVSNQHIIYYQSLTNEQFDASVENSLPSIVYSSSDDKQLNHTISKDDSQSSYQLDTNTKWIIHINISDVLTNYLFATLKQYRTFEGIKNKMTVYGDIDHSIHEYIKNNILNKYKFSNINMYILYSDIHNSSILRFTTKWDPNIANTQNLMTKIQTETSYDNSAIKVSFSQEKPSNQYSFSYFFDLIFEKI